MHGLLIARVVQPESMGAELGSWVWQSMSNARASLYDRASHDLFGRGRLPRLQRVAPRKRGRAL